MRLSHYLDEDRYFNTKSDEPPKSFINQEQDNDLKPTGLWYAFDNEWVEFAGKLKSLKSKIGNKVKNDYDGIEINPFFDDLSLAWYECWDLSSGCVCGTKRRLNQLKKTEPPKNLVKLVELIIRKGADVNFIDSIGYSAIPRIWG